MTHTSPSRDAADLHAQLAHRNAALSRIASELKTELFGIDDAIDRVVDALRAWYVMPALIRRPVIVCLWGLTGTGKTQLVRSLARKLGFYDRFVEVQMDGFSNGAGHYSRSISGMLAESTVREGEPGILVLDEFQRFRTVSPKNEDIKVERYQDVWALLSDGRLPPSISIFGDLEYSLADAQFDEQSEDEDEPAKPRKPQRLRMRPYEAQSLKRTLKLDEPLTDIMAWSPEQLQQRLKAFRDAEHEWETDYSKLLVFVCGNLDEMYQETADRVEDCDTDADIFHAETRRLSMIDVKKALAKRFKPEQVARLGNQHVVYPSLARQAYRRIIDATCEQYVREFRESTGLEFDIAPSLRDEIYANGVFPAQGTRPLFSTLHAVLGTPLVNAAVWALGLGAVAGDRVAVALGEPDRRQLRVRFASHTTCFAGAFELRALRQRGNADFRALLAVHESGHGLVHALLFGKAPQEVKINVASFEGGYALYGGLTVWSRRNWLDRICVTLAGRAAEAMVFGQDACTTGAERDLEQATEDASRFARHFAFGDRLSRTDVTTSMNDHVNTDLGPTNAAVERLVTEQLARARELLETHVATLLALVHELVQHGEVGRARLGEILGLPAAPTAPVVLEPYAERLERFTRSQAACAEPLHSRLTV